jgi:methylated-DNA-[protein]-cysteine S-methyltransferase
MDDRPVIDLWVEEECGRWYGVAWHDDMLVATVVAETRSRAERILQGCLPDAAPLRPLGVASPFAADVVALLARLEAGDESAKRFSLSPAYVASPLREILTAAAAIPLGYVSTYGSIAEVAGTIARVVGHAMATNPLYPIVPCHRVVGSDMSLVGYGGRQTPGALRAKLDRLRAEARGSTEERRLDETGGLRIFPVEWVVARAARGEEPADTQLSLW